MSDFYFNLLSKYPHWDEVLSVLTYGGEAYFVSKHRQDLSEYKDPFGETHKVYAPSECSYDMPMVVNGSIHLETHPLSKGVIPYSSFKRKLAIEHTTGCSPWDFLQMVDLAKISRDGDPEFAQGCFLTFLMYKKFYDRFMKSDFTDTARGKDVFEGYKKLIDDLINTKYIDVINIEPSQFWLDNVPYNEEKDDAICILMNWCNFKKMTDVQKLSEIVQQIHQVSGRDIHIKLHSYSRESFLKYLNFPYVKIIKYDECSKYDIMDKYYTYFVDGTGIGYETAYRSQHFGRQIDIFNISGFASEYDQFEGVKCMNVLPVCDQEDFIKGARQSNYPDDVIKDFFPHKSKMIPFECYNEIKKRVNL